MSENEILLESISKILIDNNTTFLQTVINELNNREERMYDILKLQGSKIQGVLNLQEEKVLDALELQEGKVLDALELEKQKVFDALHDEK